MDTLDQSNVSPPSTAASAKTYLVTGGAGFIGSHLVDRLLETSHRVTVLSRNAAADSPNLRHLTGHQRLRVVAASADDRAVLDAEIPAHDFVFHLASPAGVKQIVDHPLTAIRSIVGTSEAVLEACSHHRRPILIASTSEVYGK